MFFRKKFNIICYNEQEWLIIQDELFKLDYTWEYEGKRYANCGYKYPRVIKNHRNDDIFASKYLIMDTYDSMNHVMLKYNRNFKFINAKSFIRKRKLKKLKK